MSDNSKIEWTTATWSPVIGCSKCSPGCDNCYAERMACRLKGIEEAKFDDIKTYAPPDSTFNEKYIKVISNGKWNGNIVCDESVLDAPLHWKKPRKIFVCSMSDLFHKKVPDEFIHEVWDVMKKCPQHIFQVLTKRPTRMYRVVKEHIYRMEAAGHAMGFWSHVWLGVSISTQKEADDKIPILLQIPAAIHFVSIEPMLEGIDLQNVDWNGSTGLCTLDNPPMQIGWVIVGGESGSKRRWCNEKWVKSIVSQCESAGVPCFVKQIHRAGKLIKMPPDYPQEYPNEDKDL